MLSQHNQREHVRRTVTDQVIASRLILTFSPVGPQLNGQLAVSVAKIMRSGDLKRSLDTLQATGQSSVVTRPAQIKMWTRKIRNVKCVKDSWYIKSCAVKRSQQRHIVEEVEEIIEILVLNESVKTLLVPANNDRD